MILSGVLALLCLGSFSQAAQDINGNPVLVLGDVVPIDSPGTWYSDLHPCPAACLSYEPASWTVYSTVERLSLCAEPMLLDFAIFNPLDDKDTTVKLRACTTAEGNADTSVNALFEESAHMKRGENATAAAFFEIQKGTLSDAAITALKQLPGTSSSTRFVAYNGTFAGAYVGSAFGKSAVAMVAAELVKTNSIVAQLCRGRNTKHLMGVAVSTDLAEVQRSIVSWAEAKCVAGQFSKLSIPVEEKADVKVVLPRILPRANCVTTNVFAGDTCATLATQCGITAATFTNYNPSSTLCNTLQEGQRVCCSAGTVPDIRPTPNADGSCSSYTVKSGDNCASIAARLGLTTTQLALFNDGVTWGWNGCNNLAIDINICLSSGKPSMPAPIANAICGPTKPGTQPPQGTVKMEDLNPCALNACCNVWGQCGVTDDFCLLKKGPFNNPGTAPPGTNGCISSCGTTIIKGPTAPASFGRVGYYESWNMGRPCATMRAEHANTDGSYTIMHWAFMEINPEDWTMKLKDEFKQWEGFKNLKAKRVISFGGWAFSNEMPTYDILRQAMSPGNRATFAANCVRFITEHNLDGLDFDWEYPGATDIPTTPNGSPADGVNYYKFLTVLKSKMPVGKTLSIAAPSSYWYLKNFPIKLMSDVLDYIVYMTYDLHGQWDAGNQWAMDGCPTGNCLRSHVNITEVEASLSMVTKAGVPASKIFVGETSYGRSFRMARNGCTGPMCQFLGTNTTPRAKAGRCTGQGGIISNFEIDEIIAKGGAQSWHDDASNSDILVYDTTEWVAYMTDATKSTRRDHWKGFNLGGTIDWAVDLQTSTNSGGGSGDGIGGWPKVTNGQCKGSDCVNNMCVGPSCASLGCDGLGCVGGLCITSDCTLKACTGANCTDGACSGSGCKSQGCNGPDCGTDGKCGGPSCVSLGCTGADCYVETGICSGNYCGIAACGGSGCQNGVCLGGFASCLALAVLPSPAGADDKPCGKSCGSACEAARKREVVPTDHVPTLKNGLDTSNVTIFERQIKEPGVGDWGRWYQDLKEEPETRTLDNDVFSLGTHTSVEEVTWGDSKQSIVVEGLHGCIAIVCVSHKGAFVAHIFQGTTLFPAVEAENFPVDVTYVLKTYLESERSPMRNAREPSCHVMSGTNGSIRDNTAEEQETLDKSDPRGPKFPHHEKNIVAQLKGLIPDVDVQTFTYTRQRNEDFFIGAFGYGKAAVLFDPTQNAGNNQFAATVEVYLQANLARVLYIPGEESDDDDSKTTTTSKPPPNTTTSKPPPNTTTSNAPPNTTTSKAPQDTTTAKPPSPTTTDQPPAQTTNTGKPSKPDRPGNLPTDGSAAGCTGGNTMECHTVGKWSCFSGCGNSLACVGACHYTTWESCLDICEGI